MRAKGGDLRRSRGPEAAAAADERNRGGGLRMSSCLRRSWDASAATLRLAMATSSSPRRRPARWPSSCSTGMYLHLVIHILKILVPDGFTIETTVSFSLITIIDFRLRPVNLLSRIQVTAIHV